MISPPTFLAAAFGVFENALGGGEDGNSHAIEDSGDFAVLEIRAAAGGADAAYVRQGGNAADVFEDDVYRLFSLFAGYFVGGDITLVFEDRGYAFAELGVLRLAGFLSGLARIADDGEKVSDAIVSCHNDVPFALPGRFGDSRELAVEGEFAEGYAGEAELAYEAARAAP